jgi:hypothetical protein
MIANRGMISQQPRMFSSVAYNIKDKFEAAYAEKMAASAKVVTQPPEPKNKTLYG